MDVIKFPLTTGLTSRPTARNKNAQGFAVWLNPWLALNRSKDMGISVHKEATSMPIVHDDNLNMYIACTFNGKYLGAQLPLKMDESLDLKYLKHQAAGLSSALVRGIIKQGFGEE